MSTRSEGADAALNELLAAVKSSVDLLHRATLGADAEKPTHKERQDDQFQVNAAKYIVEHAPALIAELRQIPEVQEAMPAVSVAGGRKPERDRLP